MIYLIIGVAAGIVIGLIAMKVASKQGLDSSKTKADEVLKEANSKAETIL